MITKPALRTEFMLCHKVFLSKNKGSVILWSRVAPLLKKKLKEEISAESQSRSYYNSQWHYFISYYLLGVVSYPEFLLCIKELSELRLSEKRIIDGLSA